MTKHTRGPWTFESYPFGHKPRVFSPGKLIAEVGNAEDETLFHDEWVANARLIAAAPDMLAALVHVEAIMTIVPPRTAMAEYRAALDQVRGAIAKASVTAGQSDV